MRLRASAMVLLLLAVLTAGQLGRPAASQARASSASPQSLSKMITVKYKWAVPTLRPITFDRTQFSLSLVVRGKSVSLQDGIGAELMYLYTSQLKGQNRYLLVAYFEEQGGAALWNYQYQGTTKQLTRLQSVKGHSVRTTWYITVQQIAQAAKVGHWPKGGVIRTF